MRRHRIAGAIVAVLLTGTSMGVADAAPRPPITIQILDVSHWHAQLDPLSIGNPAQLVGGAAVLSTYFEQDRASNPNTVTLTAGGAFGASPPLSNLFNEEPAVLAMNAMGFSSAGSATTTSTRASHTCTMCPVVTP